MADTKENRAQSGAENESPSASAEAKLAKPDLSLNTAQSQEVSPKAEPAAPKAPQPPAPVSATGSRPNTPLTNASRLSDSSAARQPKVLRVVDNSKTENAAPMSATQSVSSMGAGKVGARQPSVSTSTPSRPDTPGEFGSEGDFQTSASVSRANSPPAATRIGTAPVRAVTKSQAKKDRKQKAKEAEAKKQENAPPVEEPVQAPILGRKRKTKKTPANTPESSSAAAGPVTETSKAAKESEDGAKAAEKTEQPPESAKMTEQKKPSKEAAQTSVEDKTPPADEKDPEEAWHTNNTLEQLLKDHEATLASIKDLVMERSSPLPVLLGQLHQSGEYDLNNAALFNPTNLNQRVDMKCTADDYDLLKRPIQLNEEHRKTLLRGEPVRINGDSDELKYKCLITPKGCVLRHLSREEEDRYLEFEKGLSSKNVDAFQDYPDGPITEPDVTNSAGGLEALFATPETFNICWTDEASACLAPNTSAASLPGADPSSPLDVLSTMQADSTRNHDWAVANTAELVNATAASVRSFAAATAKHMLGAAGVAVNNVPDLDDMVGMTDEELRAFASKAQKELELSRKELDGLDKKDVAVLKRNKKLAQQALDTTIET